MFLSALTLLRHPGLVGAVCIALNATQVTAAPEVFCSPFVPHTIVVGDKTHDPQCDVQTIQDAVGAAVCPNTTIYLTAEENYVGQHVTLQDLTVSIVGSTVTSCSAATSGPAAAPASVPTTPVTTIHGDGSHSVFTITGNSSVTFQYVEITGGGGDSTSHGGGIDFNGTGSLTLDTTLIDLNSAGFGGGIEMNGNGGNATLTLQAYSVIESNTASGNGGGINVEGRGHLIAVEPFTTIGFNHAPNGKGGGIAVVDPATADLGSPGYEGVPVVNGNDAALGGGISAQGATNGQGYVNLFTTDPLNPVTVSGNFASAAGGAVYLLPSSDAPLTGVPILLCAADFRIDGNSAPEGSAIYADHSADNGRGGAVVFNQQACPSAYLSHACKPGVDCNTLSGNSAKDAANNPKPGSVVVAYHTDESFLVLDRFTMRGNSGLHAIRTISADSTIRYCLIADNTFSGEMISLENDDDLGVGLIVNCTIAGNAHNSGSILHAEHTLYLDNSILDQPFMSSISFGEPPSISASHILAADPTNLPAQADIVQGEPIFQSALNGNVGDYHQAAFVSSAGITASLGIDAAPPMQDTNEDLDGNPYDQNVAGVGDATNVRDLGCYEAQPIADRVFSDAFGDPVSLVY